MTSSNCRDWVNEESWHIVFRGVYVQLRRWGYPENRAADESAEATQFAIEKVLTVMQSKDFASYSHFVGYWRKAAIRRICEEARRRRAVPLSEAKLAVEQDLDATAMIDAVRDCLAKEEHSEDARLLRLRYEEQHTDSEIAELLLPADDRSREARAQDLRKRRLAAEERIRDYLQSET